MRVWPWPRSSGPVPRLTRRLAINVGRYVLIVVVTLVLTDSVLMVLGLFPPTYDYGHPTVGWLSAEPTGQIHVERCWSGVNRQLVPYTRNEDGLRTPVSAARLSSDTGLLKIGVSGDSHTDLCEPDSLTHFGVMERELTASGVDAAAFSYGAGKYSPLQAYLAVSNSLDRYGADVFVLNFYTGNDFHDMLRIDDRPHFVGAGSEYQIAPPVWFQLDEPGVRRHSRVIFALRALSKRVGAWRLYVRVRYLLATALQQDAGIWTVLAYMNDLRRSMASDLGYEAAFTAQMLNQELFFHRFPGTREESTARVRVLLRMIRRSHPDRLLVLSAIPSYQLVEGDSASSVLKSVFGRLPISLEESVHSELGLYESLRSASVEEGWLFVDNLTLLQSAGRGDELYNSFDYHITPAASEIIGHAQARVIRTNLGLK